MNEIKATFPHIGIYTDVFEEMLRALDVAIVKSDITEKTIKLGVKYSPVMMCHPFKISLGCLIDALDNGANKIVHYSTCGQCRFRHYWKIQEQILRELGYEFEVVVLHSRSLIWDMKKINPSVSYFKIIKVIYDTWRKIRNLEKSRDEFNYGLDKNDINILLSGEIFTVLESRANLDIIEKLKVFGAKPKLALSMGHFIKEALPDFIWKDRYMKEAETYVDGPTGGHAVHTISHALYAHDRGYDGIIHILPMSCAPEVLIEPVINSICQKNGMPLLAVEVDENNSELNTNTRLETFIELIRRKKNKNG